MDIIKVVCGVIFKENQIFICRRKSFKILGGLWEFPGGKLESKESHEICLKRELQEELGMKIHQLNYLTTVFHKYETFRIELIAYECVFLSATFNLIDHDIYEWVKLENLINYDLAPADIPILEYLIEKFF